MKINLLILVLGLLALVSCNKFSGNASAGSASADLAGEIDTVSYSIGVDLANMVVSSNIREINGAAFMEGFNKVMNNDTSDLKIKISDARTLINGFLQREQIKQGEKNKKAGEVFLDENKNKPGVKVLPSGVQYMVLKEGRGRIPVDTSIVKVHYTGTLIDGTVFESSLERNQPMEIHVNRVIQGWQEVLKMMPVGSKWKVFIPQELAYGANVRPGGKIQPNMALVFEIELLDIVIPNQ